MSGVYSKSSFLVLGFNSFLILDRRIVPRRSAAPAHFALRCSTHPTLQTPICSMSISTCYGTAAMRIVITKGVSPVILVQCCPRLRANHHSSRSRNEKEFVKHVNKYHAGSDHMEFAIRPTLGLEHGSNSSSPSSSPSPSSSSSGSWMTPGLSPPSSTSSSSPSHSPSPSPPPFDFNFVGAYEQVLSLPFAIDTPSAPALAQIPLPEPFGAASLDPTSQSWEYEWLMGAPHEQLLPPAPAPMPMPLPVEQGPLSEYFPVEFESDLQNWYPATSCEETFQYLDSSLSYEYESVSVEQPGSEFNTFGSELSFEALYSMAMTMPVPEWW